MILTINRNGRHSQRNRALQPDLRVGTRMECDRTEFEAGPGHGQNCPQFYLNACLCQCRDTTARNGMVHQRDGSAADHGIHPARGGECKVAGVQGD